MKTIGESMKRCRKERGLSIRDLAEKSDLSPTTICHYEHDRTTPGLFKLWQLADVLEFSVDADIGRTGND